MVETRRLKNVIFFQTILSFVLSRKILNIYNNIARKYANVTVKDFWKYEQLEYKKTTKIRHQLSQQLQTTWCVSEITYTTSTSRLMKP